MRSNTLLGTLVGIGLVWGPQQNAAAAEGAAAAGASSAPTNAVTRTNTLSSLVGTWHWREGTMLVELSSDRHWRWWNLEQQSGRPSEPPFMNGKWFIHESDLYLRIDHHKDGGGHSFGPGMAIVFEVKAATTETLRLKGPGAEGDSDIVWKRVAEQTGPANGSSEANRTPGAAGSRR